MGAVESDISAFEIVVACGAILSPYRRNAESSEDTPCATPGTSTSFGCNDYESREHIQYSVYDLILLQVHSLELIDQLVGDTLLGGGTHVFRPTE